MSKIPPELREDMSQDPFYQQCCLTGRDDEKIDWHHNLTFGGKNVQEKFCILPITQSIHQYHQGLTSEVKQKLNWIMLNRATENELRQYSKATDYIQERERLNKIYD